MNEFIFITSIVLFLATIVLTNNYFNQLAMKLTERQFQKKYGYSIEKMSFSYEQMVYLVKLPSNSPALKGTKKEQIYIDYDYSSFIFPSLKGISVNLKTGNEKITLAYLTIDNYRSPILDKLFKEGIIDEEMYRKISTSKIKHPKINEMMIDEVFKKLQVGRYKTIKEGVDN
ncbi:MAG: hypothetical protein ACK4M9_00720 [Anaerobacillus sp.]|uniref:hypothetical protein n=1 Tax=Anaerobacillus sp. TaxID=1872506 RepID=UPI00391D4843